MPLGVEHQHLLLSWPERREVTLALMPLGVEHKIQRFLVVAVARDPRIDAVRR